MADNNVDLHVDAVLAVCKGPYWRDVWAAAGVVRHTFETIGLSRPAPDSDVWRACQAREILLVTANRNSDDPESLEATIRGSGTVASLPVLTLADPDRI